MTVEEYFKEWEGFDFFTAMSDDHRVYYKGQEAKSRLKRLAIGNEVLLEICDKFLQYENSLGQSEKPKLEDYK